MLTRHQINSLNRELERCDLPLNPLVRLIIASKRADLALDRVLEHLMVQLVNSTGADFTVGQLEKPVRE